MLRRVLFVLGVAFGVALGVSPAFGTPVPGIDFAWDARAPGANPSSTWAGSVGGQSWSVQDALYGPAASAYPGITHSYAFDLDNHGLRRGSFQNLAGNPTDTSSTLELWFKPDSLSGARQVIFETGGNTRGMSIILEGDALLFRLKDGASVVSVTHTLNGSDVTDFVQFVGVIDLVNDVATVYVNGSFANSAAAVGISDWAGGNGSGLGARNSQVGGNNGDLGGADEFAGQIALLRFYADQTLSTADVLQNYHDVVTPEPSTALLVGLGLVGLGVARHRSRRMRG